MRIQTIDQTFINRLSARTTHRPGLYHALLVFMASLFIAALSQVSIPLQPVPVTLQTTAVIIVAAALGPRLGAYAVMLYLFEGMLGLPVFANFHAGIEPFIGPTGGYLIGFVPAAFIHGKLMEKGMAKNIGLSFVACLISTVVVYAFGVTYLAYLTNWHTAFMFGVAPCVLTAPLKLIVVSLALPNFWKPV